MIDSTEYNLTDDDKIIFLTTDDIFKLGKPEFIINRICNLYETLDLDDAIDKFGKNVDIGVEKVSFLLEINRWA